jgi:alpha,alpha-trehalose phosphorylase
MDLRDPRNTRDGVHMASLAGSWLALVAGYGGMRDHGGQLSFAPRLPDALTRLSFALRWRQSKLRVTVTVNEASYSLEDGSDAELELLHHGEPFTLTTEAAQTFPIKPMRPPATKRPTQPRRAHPGTRRLSRLGS